VQAAAVTGVVGLLMALQEPPAPPHCVAAVAGPGPLECLPKRAWLAAKLASG
jgi:hypothetical protein